MNPDQPASNDFENLEGTGRQAWKAPKVTHLRAGAAETNPGSRAPDGPLETLGS